MLSLIVKDDGKGDTTFEEPEDTTKGTGREEGREESIRRERDGWREQGNTLDKLSLCSWSLERGE